MTEANKNPLKGIISDEAFKEFNRIQDSLRNERNTDKIAATSMKAMRVITAELDVADGKTDGIIEKATVLRKFNAIKKIIPAELQEPMGGLAKKIEDLPISEFKAAEVNHFIGSAIQEHVAKLKALGVFNETTSILSGSNELGSINAPKIDLEVIREQDTRRAPAQR